MAACYSAGLWPPGVSVPKRGMEVFVTLIKTHGRIAAALRAHDTVDSDGDGRATNIGIAHNMMQFQAATADAGDVLFAGLADDVFNQSVLRAAITGQISIHVPFFYDYDGYDPLLVHSIDYIGLNYYQRIFVRADLGSSTLSHLFVPASHPRSELLNWEIYPQGLYDTLLRLSHLGLPIYVTENGISDADDKVRPAYLRAHLYAIEQAAMRGVDVRGYFHWALTDNFEWDYGFAAKMGLFAIDFSDPALPRTPRAASVATFKEIARNLGLQPSD
jgi:beta-glucosidase